MTEEREQFGVCEFCDKPIFEGDTYYISADGCDLCADHAPTLSDAIKQHEQILADKDEWAAHECGYDDLPALESELIDMKARLAAEGDRSLATGANHDTE